MRINLYRTYQFTDKDPVIDQLRTMLEDNGLLQKQKIVHELSGVSISTLHNWFKGNTKRPQHATIAAVSSSLGYEMEFRKARRIDVEAERIAAMRWANHQEAKKRRQEMRGHRSTKSPAAREARAMRKGQ